MEKQTEKHEGKAKKTKRKNGTGTYRFVRGLLGWFVRLIHRIHIVGRENEPDATKGPYLLVCNHLQWCDPIWICVALKYQQPHYMAKKELFGIPVLGGLIRKLGAYPVNRGGADVGAVRHTIELLKNGVSVGMFPQGHRYPGVEPRTTPIRPGAGMIAQHADVPVLPVFIKTKDNRPKFLRRVDIIIGKPIPPEELHYNKEASGEYARMTEEIFERVCALGDSAGK